MASSFFGRYEHSLDAKGRVVLPSRFRGHFAVEESGMSGLPASRWSGYLTRHPEGCIALWPADTFEDVLRRMQDGPGSTPEQRNLARAWSSSTSEAEIDKFGRVPIPPSLRTYAGLEDGGSVLVIGVFDRVELWSPAAFERVVVPFEAELSNPPPVAAP